MLRRASCLLLPVALAACAADQPADRADGEMAFIGAATIAEPAEGAVVGPDVRVRLSIAGVEVARAEGTRVEGQGHHHIFVDQALTPAGEPIPAGVPGIIHMGDGSTEYSLTGLAPGEHRLIAVLAYGNHVPMERVATDTVRFVVQAP